MSGTELRGDKLLCKTNTFADFHTPLWLSHSGDCSAPYSQGRRSKHMHEPLRKEGHGDSGLTGWESHVRLQSSSLYLSVLPSLSTFSRAMG